MSLRRRVIEAGVWTLGGYGTSQVLRLANNLIMTRLLLPEDFGLMAVVNTIPVALALLTDFGVVTSVIRSQRGEDVRFLTTGWTIQILRGLLIWLLTCGVAATIFVIGTLGFLSGSTVYADQRLPTVLAVASFSIAIYGFDSLNIALAQRQLVIGRVTTLEIAAQLVAIPVMIIWAVLTQSVWALVAGGLASSLVRVVGGHIFIPGARSRLGWDTDCFREFFHFGKWLIGGSLAGYIANQGDRLIFGIFLSSGELGIYAIAILVVMSCQEIIGRLIGRISLPAMSELVRERGHDLSRAYYRFRDPVSLASFALFLILLAGGSRLIELLYPANYHEAGRLVQILSLSILFIPYRTLSSVLLSFGDSRAVATVATVQALSLLITLPIALALFGAHGGAVAFAINQLWGLPVLLSAATKRMQLSPTKEFASLGAGVLMYGLVLFVW